jgi:hypothetical protein
VKSLENDCFKDLRVRLEDAGIVEWPFEFWDVEEQSRIKKRAEVVSPIEQSVYVILESTAEVN